MSAITAEPDGIKFSDWICQAPVGKTAAYALLRALGITPGKARFPGSSAAVSILTADQQNKMDAAARAIADGRSIGEIAKALAPTRTTVNDHDTGPETEHEPSASLPGPEALLARLEAGERALRTGLPLTTSEVAWLLGARPGGPEVQRGYVLARRHARNCWTLEAME